MELNGKIVFVSIVLILTQYVLFADSKNTLQFVKNIDSTLYIASKYNSSYDLISIWEKCMNNELYTFKRVSLYSNYSDTINHDVTRPYTKAVLNATSTDNIGPITINGILLGGNHTYTDTLSIVHQTADTKNVAIIVNDSVMIGDFELYADSVRIFVSNDIYDPEYLPVKIPLIEEFVEYKVTQNSIEIKLTHEILDDFRIDSYYGMQAANNATLQNKIFFINSQYPDEVDMANSTFSGPIADYPNVYKLTHSNLDRTVCQELLMYPDEGLFSEPENNINSLTYFSRCYVKGSHPTLLKTYFNQIRTKDVTSGDSYYWRGKYSWYDETQFVLNSPNVSLECTPEKNTIRYDNVVGAKYYNIHRSEDPYGLFSVIVQTSLLYYIDYDILTGNKFFYKVTAGY